MVGAPLTSLESTKPPTPVSSHSTIILAGPKASTATPPRLRVHITLNTMCMSPPCRKLAVSTVHQQPKVIATPPVMPKV
jgi:hypothetical protein